MKISFIYFHVIPHLTHTLQFLFETKIPPSIILNHGSIKPKHFCDHQSHIFIPQHTLKQEQLPDLFQMYLCKVLWPMTFMTNTYILTSTMPII